MISNNWKHYLRSFVIGSSYLVFFPYFFTVSSIDKSILNYTYEDYTFIAPVYLGLINTFSLFIANQYNLTRRMRYILFGSISPIFVSSISFMLNTYNYSTTEWTHYVISLFFKHFLVFNIIIYSLDKYI